MSLSSNPFDGYDAAAIGTHFIERGAALRVIEQRVLAPREPGNLSILGLPRTGKTSLVYHAMFERESLPGTRNMLPVWIDLAQYQQPGRFFMALAQKCIEQVTNLGWSTPAVQRAADAALQEGISWSEGYARMQRYVQKLRQARPGIRVVCVLDNFDAAAELFKADPTHFASIRSLYENPSWRVTFVTISERSLREIELLAQSAPTLHVPFQECYLTMFDAAEMQEYYARLAAAGLPITDALTGRIAWYAGNHPYLLARLGYQLVETWREKREASADDAFARVEADFRAYYTRLMGTAVATPLVGVPSAYTLMRSLIDGTPTRAVATGTDIDMLMRYGLLQQTSEGYDVFSPHFQAYLRETMPVMEDQNEDEDGEEFDEDWLDDDWQIELQDEKEPEESLAAEDMSGAHLWSLWRETERTMRVAFAVILKEKYGENWFERLKQLHPSLKTKGITTLFDRCQISLEREEKNWGARAYSSMLEYTSPQDLFALLLAEWEATFQPIFGEDPLYWRLCSWRLVEVRVLLAHNRDRSLRDFERRRAIDYYQKILAVLRPWRAQAREQGEQSGQVDLWSLWLETETALRAVVALALEKQYGEQWFERIEAAYTQDVDQRIKEYCQRWRAYREQEISRFGTRPFQDYLDFAYPQEMFAIIFSVEWSTFRPIFRADQAYLLQLAQFFAKMRNPLAHLREEAIRSEDRQRAEDCCRELLAMLRNALDIVQEGEAHA